MERFALFDCDNHTYETLDAFTRYLPKEMSQYSIAPITLPNGDEALLAGDRIVTSLGGAAVNKPFRPGSLKETLKGMAAGNPAATYEIQEMDPAWQNRDARIALMDKQGLDRALLYPGGWTLFAEEYLRGIAPLYANIHAFNRWVDDDWGFNFQDRLYSPALVSLRDLDSAVTELEFVLNRGAHFLQIQTGPTYGRSPGDPYFDPFWARANEAKCTIAFHIGEFFYISELGSAYGQDPSLSHYRMSAWNWMNTYGERPLMDTLSALIFDNIFGRYPNLHCVVSEFGAEWLPHFLVKMDKSRGMGRNGPWVGGQLTERPSAVFKRHVRVTPYPEDDVMEVIRQLKGDVSCLVMGSDYPHAEGLAEPAEFVHLIKDLPVEDKRKILFDNAMDLI